jgi:hypothetical protein
MFTKFQYENFWENCKVDQIEKNENGGVCNLDERDEKCVAYFCM